MEITATTLTFIIESVNILGIIFAVYLYFRNPQIKTDQEVINFKNEIDNLKKDISDIRETHLRNLEAEIKGLRESVVGLSLNVNTLSTIINERIPKGNPNLTPPGL